MEEAEAALVALRAQSDQEIAEARAEGMMLATFYEALTTVHMRPGDAASLTKMYARRYFWPDDDPD